MTATNHTVSGMLIGALLPLPLAIPLALASHFALDALPHYSDQKVNSDPKKFLNYLLIDTSLAASLLFSTIILMPGSWFILVACGILAASPDLMWLPHWLKTQQPNQTEYKSAIERFHHKIQWSETKKGLVIEAIWFAAIISILAMILW